MIPRSLPLTPLLLLVLCCCARPAWAAPSAALSQACALVESDNRAQVDLVRQATKELHASMGAATEEEPDVKTTLGVFGGCHLTAHGAWAFSLSSIKVEHHKDEPTTGSFGRWSLVHLAQDGSRVAISPPIPFGETDKGVAGDADLEGGNFAHNLMYSVSLRTPTFFDYDGDGEEEVVVTVSSSVHEDGEWTRGRVWTFRGGAIRLYAPARGIVVRDVRDVDGDGRPDLLTQGPYAVEWEQPGGTVEMTGPLLLAHSLVGGGFSLRDAVAVAADRAVCPSRPATLLRFEGKGDSGGREREIDCSGTALNAVCARLWGVPRAGLRARVLREFPVSSTEEMNGRSECDYRKELLHWVDQAPPVDLR